MKPSIYWLFAFIPIDDGMQVFESTELERIEDHTAHTRGPRPAPRRQSA